jgi:hypothetical protein
MFTILEVVETRQTNKQTHAEKRALLIPCLS